MSQVITASSPGNPGSTWPSRLGRLLTSSWVIFASLLLGLYLGIFHKDLSQAIGPFGLVYLALLKMCLLPFLISAITVSLSRLLRTHAARSSLKRILIVFITGVLLCGLLGVALGALIGPGRDLDAQARATLGAMVDKSPNAVDLEISLSQPPTPTVDERGFEKIVMQVVPDNIFHALANGNSLKVLFFAIIFGAAVGFTTRDVSDSFSTTIETIYHACQRVITWVNYVLPFALCALVASQIALVGIEPLVGMMRFIAAFSLVASVVLFGSSLVIWWRVRHRMSYLQSLLAMREPVLIAAGTRSSIASIPSVIKSMTEDLGFDRTMVELVAPLSITICRYGPTLYFAVATIFVAELYEIHLGFEAYLIIFIGSLLAGMASAGTSGILTITLLSMVFEPLGLPLEAALVLFIAIDPLVDIIRTVAIVYPNCAAVAVVCCPEEGWSERVSDAPMAAPVSSLEAAPAE
ncbi:MAG: sodium:dicarboxylate symporter [Microvirga sp.]|jgi:proton glutamate symport protein|nr:sodium:dicarboxylate symporter [Microvirga sp.]